MTPYLLLAVGLFLIFLEFYTPGGILAVAGACCMLAAITLYAVASKTLLSLAGFVILSIVLLVAVIRGTLAYIRRTGEENTFYLSQDQEGFQGVGFDTTLVGKEGETLTEFGPSGYVLIDKKRYAATARGAYLDKGKKVKVIGGEGSQLIVQEIQ